MLIRQTRMQLAIFTALAVFGVSTILVEYLDLDQLVGLGQYEISAEFNDATGLYPGAAVTYRGVDVGSINAVDLGTGSATARLGINEDVQIPSEVGAAIGRKSAVGEQSIELTPQGGGPPFLQPGDTIRIPATKPMPRTDELINSVHDLAASIPREKLNTVLDELTNALHDRGPDIGNMLDATRAILRKAGSNLEPTENLIHQLGPFLATQHDVSGPLRSTADNLAAFSTQLRRNDGDLRALLDRTPPAVAEATDLQRRIAPAVPQLLTDLTSTGQVVRTQIPGLSQTFVLYPAIISALQGVTTESNAVPGTAGLGIRTSVNRIPPCYKGFVPMSEQNAFADTKSKPVIADLYCKEAQNDPRAVRGTRNTQCAANPDRRAARIEDCADAGAAAASVSRENPEQSTSGTYNPETGNVTLFDGREYLLGKMQDSDGKDHMTWQQLLVK